MLKGLYYRPRSVNTYPLGNPSVIYYPKLGPWLMDEGEMDVYMAQDFEHNMVLFLMYFELTSVGIKKIHNQY